MEMAPVASALFLLLVATLIHGETEYARKYITSRGKICTDCGSQGKSYEWCYTGSHSWNWDYCSTDPTKTTYQKPCLSECSWDNDGYKCDTNGHYCEEWGCVSIVYKDYCGKTLDLSYRQFTSDNEECQDICELDKGYTYKCHNFKRELKPCSPAAGVASDGLMCLEDLCEIDENGKGSCLTHKIPQNTYSDTKSEHKIPCSRFIDLIDAGDNVCLPPDETGFAPQTTTSRTACTLFRSQRIAAPALDITYEGYIGNIRVRDDNQLIAARKLIKNFRTVGCGLPVDGQGTVYPPGRLTKYHNGQPRLDLQGPFNDPDGTRMLNFQIQLNIQRPDPSISTTIAAAVIPRGLINQDPRTGLFVLVTALWYSLTHSVIVRIDYASRDPKSSEFDIFGDHILPRCPPPEIRDLSVYSDYAATGIEFSDVSEAALGIADIQNRTGKLLMLEDHDMFPMSARELWNEALGAAVAVENLEDVTADNDTLSQLDTLYSQTQAIAMRLELEVQHRNEIPIQRYINAMRNDVISEAYFHINVAYKQLSEAWFNRIFAHAVKQLYHEIAINRDQKFLLFLIHTTPNEAVSKLAKDVVAGEMMHYDIPIPCYVKACSDL